MEAIKLIPMIVLMIAVSGVIAGAAAITLAQFATTTTDVDALNAIGNGTKGVTTVAQQFPTVAIIGVMVIIISLIMGVVAYTRLF